MDERNFTLCHTSGTKRDDFESKIGGLEYSIGKYEKLIRATVPIGFLVWLKMI
jgi:hypothetical protein